MHCWLVGADVLLFSLVTRIAVKLSSTIINFLLEEFRIYTMYFYREAGREQVESALSEYPHDLF